jgi:hypothetical protein
MFDPRQWHTDKHADSKTPQPGGHLPQHKQGVRPSFELGAERGASEVERSPADIETGQAGRNAAQQSPLVAPPPAGNPSRLGGPLSAAQTEDQPEAQAGVGPGRHGHQKKPQRQDMLVLDLPWVYHWPKVIVWLLFEGCHIAIAVGETMGEVDGKFVSAWMAGTLQR